MMTYWFSMEPHVSQGSLIDAFERIYEQRISSGVLRIRAVSIPTNLATFRPVDS